MTRDRAMRALEHGDKVLTVARAYIAHLEKQLEQMRRERDALQRQLTSHRRALVQRVYAQQAGESVCDTR
jgi:transposase-like protein